MKYVGNLLKRVIVRGNVPAWATIVTAADCQILSAYEIPECQFLIKIPVKCYYINYCRV